MNPMLCFAALFAVVATTFVPAKEDEFDATFKAIELLSEKKVIDDKTRTQLKKKLFTATERQFKLLNKALDNYIDDENSTDVLEWINAFLESN
ncbi:hypothetical protein JG688_00012525 [Phytophthora aleatoria]|uniref:RxLR effector protein n=1 Tax=Phytophthora aleatoria TaxID=2496075 RepID=A0A8J5IJ25_9STRA|nr:hypothetical protein JG688_00012525 [Phytophthora aleatoria]